MVFIAPSLCRNYISADVLFCRKRFPYISHANSKLCKSQINFTSFWFHHLLVQKSLVWKPNHSFFSNPWFIICNFGKWRSLVPPLPLHSPLDALSNLVWHSDTSRWLVHRFFLSDRDSIKTWYVTSGASSPTHPTISSLSKHPQLSILYTSPPRPEPSKALAVHNASE